MKFYKKIKEGFFFKYPGSSLLELMLSISIGSVLLLMLYQSFNAINNGVFFLKNISNLHSQRTITSYHLMEDVVSLLVPIDLLKFYESVKKINDNKKDKSKAEEQKEKENKQLKNFIKEFILYLPEIISNKDNENLQISWVTTRSALSKDKKHASRVKYSFSKIKTTYKKEELYELKRSQQSLIKDLLENKNKEYKMIYFISEPKIAFVMPFINDVLKEEKEEKEEKKEQNKFLEWKKNPQFEIIYNIKFNDETDFLKTSIIPYKIIITGIAKSFDGKRSVPISFEFSVAGAEYALECLLNFEEKLKKTNNKQDNKQDNKQNNKEDDKQNDN